ncbi:MAG: insulinase family protein [Candidatus Aminicenantes bacterium]|nr:insulinase family protein [Candidatus Aminicenantes bacterium]
MASKRPLRRLCCSWLGVLLLLAGSRAAPGETRLFSFTTSKGLAVKVLQDNGMPFIHAQLYIYLDSGRQNHSTLAIAQLAVMNMFERGLNSPSSNLMDLLQRQGNDFAIERTPEFVKISMNLLPDRLSSFSRLLKEIFNYQAFHLRNFNRSKEDFWSFFKRNKEWRKEVALMLAYQQVINNFYFGQAFLQRETLAGINLAQLRSFLLRTFRPDNALLILKGAVNPYFILGMIEKDLLPVSSRPVPAARAPLPVNAARRIFILNVNSGELPTVFWFDIAPAATDANFLPHAIGNFTLFGFPGGRIYRAERGPFRMGGYKVETEPVHFKNFTLFCNSLRLNYGDLENFLLLVEQERRKLSARPIQRREYLDALNFYVGQAQVGTSRFSHDLQGEINRFSGQGAGSSARRVGPELVQEASFSRVLQALDEQMGYRQKAGAREKGIVVLVGNANLILSGLKLIKTEALELSLD